MGRKTGSQRRKSWRNKRKLKSKAKSISKARQNRINRRRDAVKKKAGLHPTKTGRLKIKWSAKDVAKRLTNNKIAKALGLHGLAGMVPSGLKMNVNLKTGVKSKIGEPNYRATSANNPGGGLTQDDIDAYDFYDRYNPKGYTRSDYRKIYANNLKDGRHTLEQVMNMNPANTLNYHALINDDEEVKQKAETKALDTQYKNDQAIYNNNKKNMSQAAQTDEQWLQDQYMSKFGRSADTKTTGGANYWLDQMSKNPTSHTRDEVARMLGASAEAKSFAGDGVVRPGGVKRDQSVYSQGVAGQEYAKHFQPGGALAGQNSADTLNQIAANTYKPMPEAKDGEAVAQVMPGVDGGYFQFADQDVVAQPTLPGAPKVPGTDGWWNQFADADAFKKFLGEGQQPAKQDGMGDFMKFMMLMNVMRPGGGGGYGGGGGSQFGYGGLNPGGVQAAYDPMKSLQGMGTWFKDNFGSGGGTTTGNLNTP